MLDFSKHLNRVLSVDPAARTAVVEPGAILDDITAAAARHGLRFGPDPSTHSRASIGGSIGNNACGSRALRYGRTADNVLELDVVDGTGRRFTAGCGLDPVPGLDTLVSANLAYSGKYMPTKTDIGLNGTGSRYLQPQSTLVNVSAGWRAPGELGLLDV